MKRFLLLSSFIIIFFINGWSQNIEDLRNDRSKFLKEIEFTNKLLKEKSSTKKGYLKELTLLNIQLENRAQLINNIEEELDSLSLEISTQEFLLSNLDKEIHSIKINYEKLIIQAYKRHNGFQYLLFILGSQNLSESYRRYRLLKDYSNYRKKQGQELLSKQEKQKIILGYKQEVLSKKNSVYLEYKNEQQNLDHEKNKKLINIEKLKYEENWLNSQLKLKEKQAEELERNIRKLIEQASKSEDYSNVFGDFSKYKGKLPWPVENGVVTGFYGEHAHPVLRDVKVKNNGIDISTEKNCKVKAIFGGTISRVIAIPGYNKAIIMRHGRYITVYANLASIYVKSGDKIEAGKNIGLVYNEVDSETGNLHFEIWQESKKHDPVMWLKN